MANEEHIKMLKQGADIWNAWRLEYLHKEIPDLRQANLSGANFSNADLQRANLSEANLTGVDFQGANLTDANLTGADISETDIRRVNLSRANLRRANLQMSNLIEVNLNCSDLRNADLREVFLLEVDLTKANLSEANLESIKNLNLADLMWTKFCGTNLSGISLSWRDLRGTDFQDANLSEADLSGANLSEANLVGACLSGANLNRSILRGANLSGADLSLATMVQTDLSKSRFVDCKIYGISAWDVRLDHSIQKNLTISPLETNIITVNDLEVAQFIYLLMNNKRIRNVIDTITSKVVLVLGRFSPEQKPILDSIRDKLVDFNYVPVMFDFERPRNRDFIETVATLAHMARFIIADTSEARIVLEEIPHIVRAVSVPVIPLLRAGEEEPVTLFNLRRNHRSLLETFEYRDESDLLHALKEKIIDPAETRAREIINL